MKIILGAAQIGLDYGVTNHSGKPTDNAVTKLLDFAGGNGIEYIDSADAYGDANDRIGQYHQQKKSYFRIINKILRYEVSDLTTYFNQINKVKQRLFINQFDTLMVHNPALLLQDKYLQFLLDLKKNNLTKRLGVSIQSPEDIERLLDRFVPDVVQLPINIFDQRALLSDTLKSLKSRGIEIHARSLFLQGVLLSSLESLAKKFSPYSSLLQRYHKICDQAGLTKLQASLGFVNNIAEVDYLVVGCQRAEELSEIVAVINSEVSPPVSTALFSPLACSDEKLILPTHW